MEGSGAYDNSNEVSYSRDKWLVEYIIDRVNSPVEGGEFLVILFTELPDGWVKMKPCPDPYTTRIFLVNKATGLSTEVEWLKRTTRMRDGGSTYILTKELGQISMPSSLCYPDKDWTLFLGKEVLGKERFFRSNSHELVDRTPVLQAFIAEHGFNLQRPQ